MFVNATNLEKMCKGFISAENWKPLPDIDDRQAWQKVCEDPRMASSVKAMIHYADQTLDSEIDPLTGTMYMAFMRNGDRMKYEENQFRRRVELSHLVMAECLTNERRYLDRIYDYFWAILGEIYWCVPAHNFAGQHEMVVHKEDNPWKKDDPFPVPGDEYLDLFNCETAATLAEACYLLKPLLMRETPALYHLIIQQVEERSLAKLEGQKLYGWFHGKNNWTVWCAHNLLLAACYIIEDKSRLIAFATKLMQPMQRFFNNLEPSGSCIEGPTYWNVSAGRLAGFIDLVESRFNTDLEFDDDEKFRNFGEHILKLHIGDNKYVNFADGALKIDLDHGLLSRYAQKIGASDLVNLIWHDVERVAQHKLSRPISQRGHNAYNRQVLVHLTRLLFWTPTTQSSEVQTYPKSVWLDDMQVMITRQHSKAGEGLAMSAIAGSNDLAINHHSHNDVGQFSIYLDGEPVIIDLGQGAYSKSTFSEKRYEKWHISSEGHNVVQPNGLLQRPGEGADARDVVFEQDGDISRLKLDAAPAYFEQSNGQTMIREITFNHALPEVSITDQISLDAPLESLQLPLYVSDRAIEISANGHCLIGVGEKRIVLEADNMSFDKVEPMDITDPRHQEVWGDRIFKISLTAQQPETGSFKLTIRVE